MRFFVEFILKFRFAKCKILQNFSLRKGLLIVEISQFERIFLKKILILDDGVLGKLLAKKIGGDLGFEADCASSYAEFMGLLDEPYLLCFVNLPLNEAKNDEILAFLSEKNIPAVVFSDDLSLKNSLKNTLAFIQKDSPNCVESMIKIAKSLAKCENSKVILAMSKLPERNELKKALQMRRFNVLAAAHGEEALNYLADNADTSLIICDAKMPVVDGLSLMNEVKEMGLNIDFIALGEKDDALEAEFLANGVSEFITKPVSSTLFNARFERYLQNKDRFELTEIFADIEPRTGARTNLALKNEFEDLRHEDFVFALMKIDDLANLQEEFGVELGEIAIKTMVKSALNELKGRDIVGHVSFEKVCILLKGVEKDIAEQILSQISQNIANNSISINLDEAFISVSIGFTLAKVGESYNEVYKRADDALKNARSGGKGRIECI